MATYHTAHQYEPLCAPESWGADGRRFVVRLTEILDDIYRRYGRLTTRDLGRALNRMLVTLDTGLADVQGEAGALSGQMLTVAQALSQLSQTKLDSAALLNRVYPVGAIYLSVDEASPATLFGGVWQRLGGRFLLGANDAYAAGTQGGEAAHTLTPGELPAHAHALPVSQAAGEGGAALAAAPSPDEYTELTLPAGGGQPHNNLPPYLAVYMWKRTE